MPRPITRTYRTELVCQVPRPESDCTCLVCTTCRLTQLVGWMQERVRAALTHGDSSLARNELAELLMASAERMTSILSAVVQHVPTNSPRPGGAFPRRGKVRDHDGT
jgi:hypothetical protein